MLFTDESRFGLDFTDRRQLVWRMPKERFDEINVAEHGHYGKGSVMFGQTLASAEKLTCTWLVSGLPGALYSILRFVAALLLLSNCKQLPYWILFRPLRVDTPTFQTKNKQHKLSFLIDFPQKLDP